MLAGQVSATASSSLALDGSAQNGCGYVTSCSVSLTTTQSSDVVVVGCDCWPNGAAFTVKDTAGLTFTPRTVQVGIGGGQFIQTWYAIAPSPLSGDSISVVASHAGETWYGVIAFAVSGANTASPFDSSASLPKEQENTGCLNGQPCNTGVSSSGPDFVFQFAGDTGATHQTAGAGFTMISQNLAGQNAYAQYELTSAPLSSATLSFGTTQKADFGVIADAIQQASSSSTSSTTLSSSTSSSSASSSSSSSSSTSTLPASASPSSSSTSNGKAGNGVFYLGAEAAGVANPANTGVRSYIDVQRFSVPVGCVAFWVSDDSAAGIWMQAGYYICDGSTPIVFMQVWNMSSYAVLYTNDMSTTPTVAQHQFTVSLQSGTTWVAAYDGTVIGTYNLQASASTASYPVFSTSEENGLTAPVSFPTVSFPFAIQAMVNGVWATPSAVQVYNSGANWGLQGLAQNPNLPGDSFVTGGSISTPANGSPLGPSSPNAMTSANVMASANVTASKTGIMIPLYTYPGSTWTTVSAVQRANPNVPIAAIINPDSGPGTKIDPNYVAGIASLQSAGVTVLGYTPTNFALDSISEVESMVSQYKSWYHVNGIFFDDMSSVVGKEVYYSTLNAYATSLGFTYTVGNAGTNVPASFIGTMDTIIIYENHGIPSTSYLQSADSNYARSNFAMMAYGVQNITASYLVAASAYVSYLYITNGVFPNPYGAIPPYLATISSDLAVVDNTFPITVDSASLGGSAITGLYTVVTSNGNTIVQGFTPLTFTATYGATYTISVANYKSYVFNEWSDGYKNSVRTVTATAAVTFTAYYET
jgi:hypothetical protein